MRTTLSAVALLVLAACSSPRPPRPEPLRLPVRLAPARHAVATELDVYVWPTAPPPAGLTPDDPACVWWQGAREGRDWAHAALLDGTLRWGVVSLTRTAIGFAGQDLVPLADGQLGDPDALNTLSNVLVDARRIQDAWYETCGTVYRDRPLLAVDADVPFATLQPVLGLLSMLRFPRLAALVADREPGERKELDADDPGSLVVVRQDGRDLSVLDSQGIARVDGPIDQIEAQLGTVLAGQRLGCLMHVPGPNSTWVEVAATLDATSAFGARSHFLSLDAQTGTSTPGPASPPGPSERLSPGLSASVLWVDLPITRYAGATPVTCDQVKVGPSAKELVLPDTLQRALLPPAPVTTELLLPGGMAIKPTDVTWSVQGPLDVGAPEEPHDALKPLLNALRACNDTQPPGTRGARLRFTVDPTGTVQDRQVVVSDPGEPATTCLSDALANLTTLPPPAPGHQAFVTVDVPLGAAP